VTTTFIEKRQGLEEVVQCAGMLQASQGPEGNRCRGGRWWRQGGLCAYRTRGSVDRHAERRVGP
jgi:hypothetical protein